MLVTFLLCDSSPQEQECRRLPSRLCGGGTRLCGSWSRHALAPVIGISMCISSQSSSAYMNDLLRKEMMIIGIHEGILENPQVTYA